MKANTTEFQCTIHGVKFMSETPDGSKAPVECCFCLQAKVARMREELNESNEHKRALLRAIEIKQLSEPV